MPERSRLIFSKDAEADSNYLFLDDIYDCNIRSDLAILTACESGKPGFQDGEGMVSMAHAFNYAGSNSILTGLWKIDEKASSFITDVFVKNLEQGIPAALALKKAKLHYLEQAQGRTLAPAYWAGLVLIGQTPDLKLEAPGNKSFWLFLSGAILLAVLVFFFLQRSRALKK
jgi:CHAT domain-containing protein